MTAEARRTWSKPGEEGGRNRTEIYVTTITRTTAGLNTVLHACVPVDVRTVLRNSNLTVPSRTRL